MARINFEDDVESREEFRRLLAIVQDWDSSLGKLVRFFRLAQKHYVNAEAIPKQQLTDGGLECMIASGWAVEVPGGYQSLGAEKQFAWYLERKKSASAGGKASARARLEKFGTAQPKQTRTEPEASVERKSTKPNALTLTLTPSLTLTNNNKTKETAPVPVAPPVPAPKIKNAQNSKDTSRLIARYCEVYRDRYHARPEIRGKDQGIARRLVGACGVERACQLVEAYLQMSDAWFLKKSHDLGTLEESLNKVSTALQTGREDPAKDQGWAKTVREFMQATENENGTAVIHRPNEAVS